MRGLRHTFKEMFVVSSVVAMLAFGVSQDASASQGAPARANGSHTQLESPQRSEPLPKRPAGKKVAVGSPAAEPTLSTDVERLELGPLETQTLRVRIQNLNEPATLKIEGERVVLMTPPEERMDPPREEEEPTPEAHPDKIIVLIDPAQLESRARGIDKKDIRRGIVSITPLQRTDGSTSALEPLDLAVTVAAGSDVPEGDYVLRFILASSPNGDSAPRKPGTGKEIKIPAKVRAHP